MNKGLAIGIVSFIGVAFATSIYVATRPTDPYTGAGDPGAGDPVYLEKIQTAAGAYNNPGNIKKSPTTFLGEVNEPGLSAFTSFIDRAHGYRAMIEILRHYYKTGLTTLTEAINRYAPGSDNNDPAGYVRFITGLTGISPDNDLYYVLYGNQAKDLISAMALKEQPTGFVNDIYSVNQGYLLA